MRYKLPDNVPTYERFISFAIDQKYCQWFWGCGNTIKEATANAMKAGGKRSHKLKHYRFVSHLPFAPSDREANENEADAYCTADGNTCWIRCEQHVLTFEKV